MTDCAWVNGPKVPDYALLTTLELLALWHEQRNTPIGVMAADEICRRVELDSHNEPKEAGNGCG